MKSTLFALALFVCGCVSAQKITDFERCKGGVLWQGEKSGGKFSYATAPKPRGKSALLSWQKKRMDLNLVINFWYPQLKDTRKEFDGEFIVNCLPGKGKEDIVMLILKMMDAKGEVFQWYKKVDFKKSEGWQKIVFVVNPDTVSSSYGPKTSNKKIDLPVRFCGLVVRFSRAVGTEGEIYFDDIEYKASKE